MKTIARIVILLSAISTTGVLLSGCGAKDDAAPALSKGDKPPVDFKTDDPEYNGSPGGKPGGKKGPG